MAQITYANKVALNVNPEIAAINKVQDTDMNEIKQVVNDNYNNTIQITNTEPTDSDNKIWIDTGEIAQAHTEITNEYSTSTGLGYSANYVNNLHTYSSTEQKVGTWFGKPLYRKVLIFPNGTGQTTLKTYTLSDYSITNVDEIFIVHPSFYTLSNRTYPFQYNDGTNAFECNVGATQLNVLLKYSDIANSKFVITLEYTKITD